MRKKTILLAQVLLIAVMAAAAGVVGWKLLDYRKGAQEYRAAAEIAWSGEAPTGGEEPDAYMRELAGIRLAALQEENGDVIGWIDIPDTGISYPVMRAEDNSYYLNHTWRREPSAVGAVFLDCQNKPDFSGFHNILYGHQMRDGSMFGGLHQYAEAGFLEEHPAVYLVTENDVRRYDIFAAFEAGVESVVFRRGGAESWRDELVDFCLENSAVDAGTAPEEDEDVLILSTCTGKGYATRWIVAGTLKKCQ